MDKNRKLIRDIVFIAFYVALALALELVSKMIPFEMPRGGKLELHVIALFVASFHLGWKKGGAVAILAFLVESILGMNSYLISIPVILCDYVFPLLACGIGAIFPKIGKNNIIPGVIGGMILKYASHVISGTYLWVEESEAAGSWASWSFSLGYNAWYCVPTLIAAVILVPLLINAIRKAKNVPFEGIKE